MSFPKYPEYKDSGVEWFGDVPCDWRVQRLKQVVNPSRPITYGIVQAGENVPDGIPYIRPADMADESGVKTEDALLRTSQEIASAYRRSSISAGDIVCSIGPSFGKLMMVPLSLEGANLTQGTARVAVANEHVPRFIFWVLRSVESYQQWESSVGGATFRALNLGPLAETFLCVPSWAEQTQIARFLDHETARIDALIEEQQRLIELLKEKRQALISHAVTKGLDSTVPVKDSGVEWLGKVPAHWELTRVGWQCIVGNGCTPARDNLDYWEDGHYPWLNSSKVNLDRVIDADQFVTSKALKECALPIVKQGCVLMAITGEGKTRGMVTITEIEATINQHVAFIEPRGGQLVATYIHDWLSANYSRIRHDSADWGSTKAAITCADIRAYPLPLPPKEEQEAICQFVSSKSALFDGLMSSAEENVGLLQERRSALISAAVTGKIDVRGWQPPASAQAPELEVAEAV